MCAHTFYGCSFKVFEPLTQNTIDLLNVEVRQNNFEKASTETNRVCRLCRCQTSLGILNLVVDICISLKVTKGIDAVRSTCCSGNGICQVTQRCVMFFNASDMTLQSNVQGYALCSEYELMQLLPM